MRLSQGLVLHKTKAHKLIDVRNLNVWGNEIDDVSILSEMPNVEVLALSVNNISTLKDFSQCRRLTELYLRRNQISDISELRHLKDMKSLRVLWLSDNPIAEVPNYRHWVIQMLPNLTKFDNEEITRDDVIAATQVPLPPELSPYVPNITGEKRVTGVTDDRPSAVDNDQTYVYREQTPAGRPPLPLPSSPVHSPSPPQASRGYAVPSSPSSSPGYGGEREREDYRASPQTGLPRQSTGQVEASASRVGSLAGPHTGVVQGSPRASRPALQRPSSASSANVLYAVLSLLKDLDPEGLDVVSRECQNLLHQQQH